MANMDERGMLKVKFTTQHVPFTSDVLGHVMEHWEWYHACEKKLVSLPIWSRQTLLLI